MKRLFAIINFLLNGPVYCCDCEHYHKPQCTRFPKMERDLVTGIARPIKRLAKAERCGECGKCGVFYREAR